MIASAQSSGERYESRRGARRVSLGLPVYNGEAFVAEAIQSILDQDFDDFELIITDNASSDRTEEICRLFAARDRRIRYVRNDRNLGAGGNFNRAFELGSGEFFKWCAHDDVLGRSLLKECVHALDCDPGAVIAYPQLLGIDNHSRPTTHVERQLPGMDGGSPATRFRTMLGAHGWDAAMFGLWRRDVLGRTSLHQPYYGSDCALLAEMAILGTFRRAENAIFYSRDHPQRSVRLSSKERLAWQNPDISGFNAFELSQRVVHLLKIARKHRKSAPLYRTLPHIAGWIMDPLLLARLTLEAVGMVSPRLRGMLRDIGLETLKKFHSRSGRSSA